MDGPLNMCMFPCRVDYDAAVRRRCEEEAASKKSLSSQLTDGNKERTMLFTLKQGDK